jgi:hypothetical protein
MATTVIQEFEPADRYVYDFGLLTYAKGWAQIDTRQDASYYGTWTSPTRRELFNYCEGDTTLTRCDTDEEYIAAVRECAEWNKKAGHWLGIDPGFETHPFREQFTALGLADLLR